jgi:hypothetical protein
MREQESLTASHCRKEKTTFDGLYGNSNDKADYSILSTFRDEYPGPTARDAMHLSQRA